MLGQQLGDAAVNQEKRLRGVAQQLQSGVNSALRHGGEIDVGGDVLQTGPEKRLIMGVVTVVAHQRAAVALWVEILVATKTIVDPQQRALLQSLPQTGQQTACRQIDFADIRRLHWQGLRRRQQFTCPQRPVLPGKALCRADHPALINPIRLPGHQMHRQRIQHLVGDQRAAESFRQCIQPHHALAPARRQARLLALAQIRADFQNGVLARQTAQLFQFVQQILCQLAAARAQFQHLRRAGLHHLLHLSRQSPTKKLR